ncbi:MAG: peptidoglycan editing factor PgeF [Rickettsiaceae bacterium]|nr:peptidoglycan editing factor PgeF [Rickettsiaceae bacterium]
MNNKIDYRFFDKTFQASSGVYFPKGEATEADAQQNRKAVAEAMNGRLALLKQVHSPIATFRDGQLDAFLEADAHVTNLPSIVLGILTADCVPVLFYSSCGGVIGAAHCGWRSARHGIIANTIGMMKGLGAKDISAVIGPAIQKNSYEVSSEFYEDFISESAANDSFFERLSSDEGKFYFDLPSYVEAKILEEGAKCAFKSKDDTYSNATKYHSRRRSFHDGCDYNGSLLSTIVIKPC